MDGAEGPGFEIAVFGCVEFGQNGFEAVAAFDGGWEGDGGVVVYEAVCDRDVGGARPGDELKGLVDGGRDGRVHGLEKAVKVEEEEAGLRDRVMCRGGGVGGVKDIRVAVGHVLRF